MQGDISKARSDTEAHCSDQWCMISIIDVRSTTKLELIHRYVPSLDSQSSSGKGLNTQVFDVYVHYLEGDNLREVHCQ